MDGVCRGADGDCAEEGERLQMLSCFRLEMGERQAVIPFHEPSDIRQEEEHCCLRIPHETRLVAVSGVER